MSGREAFNRHVDLFFGVTMIVCLIIVIRITVLQLTDLYRERSEKTKQHHLEEKWILPLRGEIIDRNGVLLATSLSFQTVLMDPFKMRTLPKERRLKVFETITKILGISLRELQQIGMLRLAMFPVKRAVGVNTIKKMKKIIRNGFLPGIEIIDEQVREYPWGDSTKAMLGVVRGSSDIVTDFIKKNRDMSNQNIKRLFPWYSYAAIGGATPQRGIGGVEQVFDTWLAGTPERYIIPLDRSMQSTDRMFEKLENGEQPFSIGLTIDVELQRFMAQLIKNKLLEKRAKLAMAVVMEAFSGEILAAYSASVNSGQLMADDSQIFTSSFEAGSVAKPMMMVYAFKLGVISEKDRFNCNSPTKIGDKVYKDEHRYPHNLTPKEILVFSSDVGMTKIVKRMILKKGDQFPTDAINFLKGCGVGENISMKHPAIPKSTLPSSDRWSAITPSQISIGYEFKVSPFHLVSLYAAFANGGRRVKPILVKKIFGTDGKAVKTHFQKAPLRECFPERYANLIHDYLRAVVSTKGGTGRRAAITGVDIAGKTGTARRLVNGKYSRKSHNSTFIGILPVRNNFTMVIGVFLQDIKRGSDYGGTACAPIFKEIAQYIIDSEP